MKQNISFGFIFLFSLFFIQCKKQVCFTDSGNKVQKERVAGNIRNIILYDNIDLVLIQGSQEKITVEAGKQLEPFIETSVTNQTVTIRNNSSCDWLRSANEKVKVTLVVTDIDRISYYGAGDILSGNTLIENEIVIDSWSGAGNIKLNIQAQMIRATIHEENADIILSGKADQAVIYSTSRGTIDLRSLQVQHMTITQRSVRDAYVNVQQSIEAVIMYKGNIYMKGNPSQRKVQTTNEGKLIDL